MTLQELQWAVAILVGLTVILGAGFSIVRFCIKIAQDFAKLVALHPRLDKYFDQQEKMNLELREIKTFLRVHPTLRFRVPDRSPAVASGPQDIFKESE